MEKGRQAEMQHGKQWLALDTQFFAKPFPIRLQERFGPTGLCLFIAFLCACKRNSPQGEISFSSDVQALQAMGLFGHALVDPHGNEWSLEEFWTFTGRMKQTKKTARGHVKNVRCTHWERWQDRVQRDQAAERQRRSRGQKWRDSDRDTNGDSDRDTTVTACVTEIESEKENPPTPQGGSRRRFASNGKTPDPPRPAVADWRPDPEPDSIIEPAVVAALRANPSGKSQ